MKSALSKEIIFMFLSGNATPLQRKLIEEWLQDESNREQYYDWLEEWEEKHPQFLPDVTHAFAKLVEKKKEADEGMDQTSPIPLAYSNSHSHFTRHRSLYWMAASVFVLLAAVGVWQQDHIFYKTFHTSYGQIKKITLEDGTVVTLNANSSLRHSRFFFGKNNREVFLQGEAEFSVTHTPDNKRFLVRTPDKLEVEVLGTEFIVFSRNRGSKVVLTKGKVQLRTATIQQPLLIHPGDVVTITPKGNWQLQPKQVTQQHSSWKEHRFVFDRTPLSELAQLLSENFGVSLSFTDSTLAERRITGTFRAGNADELLYGISQALDLNVQNQKDTLILTEN